LADEKRRAKACFAHIAFPYPPPPPVRIAHDTAAASSLWRQRERLGDLEKYEAPRKTDVAQWADDTASAIQQTDALIDALGENNPILRDMLATAKQEIYTASTDNAAFDEEAAAAYAAATSGDTTTNTAAASAGGGGSGYGRRLMQRKEYNVRMTDELITAEIMEFYGKGGIPGVTQASCESLCEATAQLDAAPHDAICKAFAFKRAAPFSYVDKTGWCYLLKVRPLAHHRHCTVDLLTPALACSERRRVQDCRLWRRCAPCVPTLALEPECATRSPRDRASQSSTRARSSRSASAPRARPGWTTRSAWASPVRGTTRGCSRTPTRPRWPRRCRT